MKRAASWLPIAAVLAFWAWSAWRHLRPGGVPPPETVRDIALFVALRAAVVLALVPALLAVDGERLASLGFGVAPLRAALGRGLLLGVALFVLINVVVNSALASAGVAGRPDVMTRLFSDPREAPLWIFAAVVGGGFTEELVRAFVLTRWEHVAGRAGLVLALLVDSALFGLGHSYQGLNGILGCGLSGLLMGLIFLRRRRVADAMVAHVVFDLLGVAAGYLLMHGR